MPTRTKYQQQEQMVFLTKEEARLKMTCTCQESENGGDDREMSYAKRLSRLSVLMISVLIGGLLCLATGMARSGDVQSLQYGGGHVHDQNSQQYDLTETTIKESIAQKQTQQHDHRHLLRKHLVHQQHNRHPQARELKRIQRDYVDCSQYEFTMGLSENLRINWVVNAQNLEDEEHPGTISIEMIYQGQAWLGFGHSENGSMVGSVAVIGVPDAPESYQVQKYNLESQSVDSIEPLQATQQTLIGTDMEQDENRTIMRFTKYLSEPDELTIHPSMQNTFLFAVGGSNELGYHTMRGIVVLDLENCIQTAPVMQIGRSWNDNTGGTQDELAVEDRMDSSSYVISIPVGNTPSLTADDSNAIPTHFTLVSYDDDNDIPGQSEAEKNDAEDADQNSTELPLTDDTVAAVIKKRSAKSQFWWTLHGVFAMITCGILLPIVIASSVLRGCFGGKVQGEDQISNNSLFRWSNVLVVIAVTITFATAVVGAQTDATNNFITVTNNGNRSLTNTHDSKSTSHSPCGLALFIALMFFALTGTLRSYVCAILKAPGLQDEVKDSDKQSFNSCEIKIIDKETGFANFVRQVWDGSHLFVGVILLFITCWESKTGLELYADRFHSWFGAAMFWGISGPIIGVVGFLCLLQMVSWSFVFGT